MDTRTELLGEIATFQDKLKMADSKIGIIALNDPKFVTRLREGRRCWPETAKKVRDFMAAAYTHITTADGTVIIRDMETGVTASGPSLPEAYAELRRLLERQAA
ncbi:hypothetical protein [Mesorhizobium ciceri]|uniref:hypothetical protein n=1 Tax=Mesorhizobium ciceri TaxID=39645 RepID=UPI0004B57B7C|nr:hypothetical protein [Mesorhizobium ciceri]